MPPAPIPRYRDINTDDLADDITFVTAYFYLERFQKGIALQQGFDEYMAWTAEFANFENTVIAFTDTEAVKTRLLDLRSSLPKNKTQIYLLQQDDLWAFKLAPRIKTIYSQPDYPKHHPNTIKERYSCAMHVKYELLERVIQNRIFHTKYLAWVDIGYFREPYSRPFQLQTPANFQQDHIAFLQVDGFDIYANATTIITDDALWVGGGMLIGRPEYLMVFIDDYKRSVESLIDRGLMDTDQQVIYIMYTTAEHLVPRVPLQLYYNRYILDWFFLGKYCRHLWQRSQAKRTLIDIHHRYM